MLLFKGLIEGEDVNTLSVYVCVCACALETQVRVLGAV